jgi:hypothetical protein
MDERDLHRMLDDAARRFDPQPDVARLDAVLGRPGRPGRGLIAWAGVAAGLALLAGSTRALTHAADSDGVRPAGDRIQVVPEPSLPGPTSAPARDPRPDQPPEPSVDPTAATASPSTAPVTTLDPLGTGSVDPSRHGADSVPPLASSPTDSSPGPVTTVTPVPTNARPLAPSTTAAAPSASPSAPPPTPAPSTAPPPASSSVPPPTVGSTTTVAPPDTVGFIAHQRWGSCDLDPPYDEFWGTAPVGSTVTVQSAHGSGQATADANGHWELTVHFPSAPVGVPFSVEVTAANGSATFTFTRTG